MSAARARSNAMNRAIAGAMREAIFSTSEIAQGVKVCRR